MPMPPFPIDDVAGLRAAVAQGWKLDFLFFWGHKARNEPLGKHVLSQWWPAPFAIGDQLYPTAEHYMMVEKARLFGDEEILSKILSTNDPAAAKALGRKVKLFDPHRWEQHAILAVTRGNEAKFQQNSELGAWLRQTGDAVLVEASPVDAIWGIGLAADDPKAQDPASWPGTNLLGFILMRVRETLRAGADG